MVFPFKHLLMTANWNTANGEEGQVGLRFLRDTLPTQTEANGCHTAFGVMWNAATSYINVEFAFTNLKFALINPNGQYPADAEPVYSTGAVTYGGVTNGPYYPLQVACAATLTTPVLRGRASKGRIYLPPLAQVLQNSSFRWADATCTSRAGNVWTMINAVEDVLGTSAVVMSRIGEGESNPITGVRVGNRADIQRSRDNRNPEKYLNNP